MRWFCFFLLAAALASSSVTPAADEKAKALPPIPLLDLKRSNPVDYAKEIEPIFADKCQVCHAGSVLRGKYDMSNYAAVMKGGKRGKAVVPGKSKESNLFLFCAREKTPVMPPEKEEPLTSQEVSLIKLWIDQGAKAPAVAVTVKPKIVLTLPPALVKPVRAVAVKPDGSIVAAGRGNQIHLFDGKTGEFKATLADPSLKTADGKEAKTAHISLVESLVFSPDGKTLASGSFQELTLWDVEKAAPKQRIPGFVDRVTAIAYSPDGKFLATGGGAATEDGEIKLFSADGKPAGEVKNGHSDTVFGIAFSPDNKLLATASADKFIKVWEVPAGKFVKSFEGHTHHVMDVAWSPDGKKLVSGGADNLVKVWDYEKGEKIKDSANGHSKQVTRVWFVNGKKPEVLTVGGDATLRTWTPEGGNGRSYPNAGSDFLYTVSASADGAVVAAGGEDGVVRVYDGAKAALIKAALPPGVEAPEGSTTTKPPEPKKKKN